jgi:hypothetical protein
MRKTRHLGVPDAPRRHATCTRPPDHDANVIRAALGGECLSAISLVANYRPMADEISTIYWPIIATRTHDSERAAPIEPGGA